MVSESEKGARSNVVKGKKKVVVLQSMCWRIADDGVRPHFEERC